MFRAFRSLGTIGETTEGCVGRRIGLMAAAAVVLASSTFLFHDVQAAVGRARLAADSLVERMNLQWMRDEYAPAVKSWVASENQKTVDFLRSAPDGSPLPFHLEVSARAKELLPQPAAIKLTTPFGLVFQKAGGVVIEKSVEGKTEEKVIAGRIVEADGSGASVVGEIRLSPDLEYLAYAYVKNGSDSLNWQVYNLRSEKVVAGPFHIRLAGFSFSQDSKSVLYANWPTKQQLDRGVREIQYREFDLLTGKDELVFESPFQTTREFYVLEKTTHNGQEIYYAVRNQVVAEIPFGIFKGIVAKAEPKLGQFQTGRLAWKSVKTGSADVIGKVIGIDGHDLVLRTSELGDGFGVSTLSTAGLHEQGVVSAKTLIPSRQDQVLALAQQVGDRLALQYFDRDSFEWTIEIANLKGQTLTKHRFEDVGFVNFGMLSGFVYDSMLEKVYVGLNETRVPNTNFEIDLKSGSMKELKPASGANPAIPFDASRIKFEKHMVKSKDGTLVPVSLFTRTDMAPKFGYVFYYGYIGIAQFGWWNRKVQLALDMGGAVLMVHHRGGGEQGVDWQLDVKRDRLPAYEDTVAAARWMKAYTGVQKLVATGRSFGGMHTLGLLAHHTNEFDLYSSVVPVSDIVEFLDRGSFGYFACDDFGVFRNAVGETIYDQAFYAELKKWSPLHQIENMTTLKPTIVFSADTDERVDPEQSYFVIEALKRQFPNDHDKIYLYEEKQNGHNARTELVDEMVFIGKHFGINRLEPLRP